MKSGPTIYTNSRTVCILDVNRKDTGLDEKIFVGNYQSIPKIKEQPSQTSKTQRPDVTPIIIQNNAPQTSNISVIPLSNRILTSSNLLGMGLLAVPLLCVFIYSIYSCYCRKDGSMSYFSTSSFRNFFPSKRKEHFDLGRLLSDPEKSGFNRVAMEESDMDFDLQSDSEVEEFNITSARKA